MDKNKTKYIIGMIVAMLIWGVAWTSGKAAVEHSNAQVSSFWRYAISLIGMLPVIWYLKEPFKTDKIGFIYMVISGILTALFSYFFFAGLVHGEAGYGGTMVTSLVPIITYFLSMIIFGTKVSIRQIIALCIGILGAIILLHIPTNGLDFLNVNSSYFLASAFVWSLVTIITQKVAHRVKPMFYTVVVFFVTGLVNMVFALPYHPFDVTNYDLVFWLNILFVGLLSGTFATAIFFISASKIGAHNTGVFMFIVPIGAIVSSMFAYDEQIELSTIIGCGLSFLAVLLFNVKNLKKKKTVVS